MLEGEIESNQSVLVEGWYGKWSLNAYIKNVTEYATKSF